MASEKETKEPWAHDGFADESLLAMLSESVTYDDDNGIKGLLRSPYIFEVALLASFGEFSFGYCMDIYNSIPDKVELMISRPGQNLHYTPDAYGPIPRTIPRDPSTQPRIWLSRRLDDRHVQARRLCRLSLSLSLTACRENGV